MRDVLGPGTTLGYCTNVHAGTGWEQTRANLLRHAAAAETDRGPAELRCQAVRDVTLDHLFG